MLSHGLRQVYNLGQSGLQISASKGICEMAVGRPQALSGCGLNTSIPCSMDIFMRHSQFGNFSLRVRKGRVKVS